MCDSTSPRLKKEGATRWVDLEDTVLSAISPTPKEKPWVIPLTGAPPQRQKGGRGFQGLGEGSYYFKGQSFSLARRQMEMEAGDGRSTT